MYFAFVGCRLNNFCRRTPRVPISKFALGRRDRCVGLYRPVHVKTLRSQKLRMLLTHRKLLQAKAIAVENDLRATLRNFGLKVGLVGTIRFEARVRELVDNFPDLEQIPVDFTRSLRA